MIQREKLQYSQFNETTKKREQLNYPLENLNNEISPSERKNMKSGQQKLEKINPLYMLSDNNNT